MLIRRGRNTKNVYEYVRIDEDTNISIQKYIESPAIAFLSYLSAAKIAITTCQRNFAKTKASKTSLMHISVAMLPAIMGHFETYQRFLFAGVFDLSGLLISFNANKFFGEDKDEGLGLKIERDNIQININGLLGYRGTEHVSVGILLADNLHRWHNPEKVNKYFKGFGSKSSKVDAYTKNDCNNLDVLWQLRHSIVHTGGTITLPDAQKIKILSSFGGKTITFENQFIISLCRKFSEIVKNSTKRIEKSFIGNLDRHIVSKYHQERIEKLFQVK
jgi:hypothetical protein